MNNNKNFLFIVILFFIIFFILYFLSSFFTPIGEAPDEAGHISYIDSIVKGEDLELKRKNPEIWANEYYQPPLYYYILSGFLYYAYNRPIDYKWKINPDFSFYKQGSKRYLNCDNTKNYKKDMIMALRLFQLIFPFLTLIFCYKSLLLITNDRFSSILFLSFMLFNPQFIFISSTVNNDNLANFFSSFLTYIILKIYQFPFKNFSLYKCIIIFFVGLLSKATIIAFLFPLILIIFLNKKNLNYHFYFIILLCIIFFIFYIKNFIHPLPQINNFDYQKILINILKLKWVFSLFVSFFAKFGQLNIKIPIFFYISYFIISFIIIVCILRNSISFNIRKINFALIVIVIFSVLDVIFYMVMHDWQPQGRFLFIAYPSILCTFSLSKIKLKNLAILSIIFIFFSLFSIIYYFKLLGENL